MAGRARAKRLAGVGAVVLVLLAVGGPATASADGVYMALGDSFTSGPFILKPSGRPAGCARSDHNYPSLVARAIEPSIFRDVSCAGATTDDMTHPQSVPLGGTNPPQFDGLGAHVGLVTIGIGGNDVNLFGIAETCVQLDLTRPTGDACRRHYTAGGDQIGERIAGAAPKIADVLQGIHARSPAARVLLVGYPDGFPPDGRGCWPVVPISPADARWFGGAMRRANRMLADEAAANGAEYVDTYHPSLGHDACKPPGVKWIEGFVPNAPAFPGHPNALGERNMARQVLALVDPADQLSPPGLVDLLG